MNPKCSSPGLSAGPVIKSNRLFASLVLLSFFMVFAGCAGDSERRQRKKDITITFSDEALDNIFTVKQIFYALPSPLETAMLLKSAGAAYNEELLNPVENVSKYMTNRSMAVNLGVYSANLSYASLFDQTQTSMNYMDAAKKLADNLGILDAIDSYTMERLEANLGNRDVILDIVSETFMNSSSFLQENNREAVAAMMFVGGWVEGLYLALNLVNEEDVDTSPLARRIVDSKMALEIMMLLLDEHSDNNDVAYLIGEMEKIEGIFKEIEIKSTPVKVEAGPDDSGALLRSQSVSNMNKEIFRKLKSTVTAIRTSFVS
jgi:hypothetical protein